MKKYLLKLVDEDLEKIRKKHRHYAEWMSNNTRGNCGHVDYDYQERQLKASVNKLNKVKRFRERLESLSMK